MSIHHPKIGKILLSLFFTLFFNGCMVGPNYKPPINTIPDEWVETPSEDILVTNDEPYDAWWYLFEDCLLDKYVEMAILYNNTLKTAEANILQARALRVTSAANLFPQIALDANATRTYFSKNGPLFVLSSPAGTTGPVDVDPTHPTRPLGTSGPIGTTFLSQIPQIQNLFNFLFDTIWEIDLFGRTRRGMEAADANIGSVIEQRNDILISVLAETARSYIEIRSFQQRERLTQQNIDLLEKYVNITQKRLQTGISTLLDYQRIESELALARSALPSILAQMYQRIFSLSVLTGQLPEALLDELLPFQPLPTAPSYITIGLRSDLLRRRPDVRRAERQLAQATANVGVAVASFYPSFTLNAFEGFQSLNLNNLFTGKSKTWSVGGDLHLPIFQGGLLIGNLRASEAVEKAALFNYRETLLSAIQEAESALIAHTQDVITTDLLRKSVLSTRKVSELSGAQYLQGLIRITDLLDSERQLISSELSLLDSETATLIDLIALYKALGGGYASLVPCL